MKAAKTGSESSGSSPNVSVEGGFVIGNKNSLTGEHNLKTTDKWGTDTVKKTGTDSDVGGGTQTG